ncbi:MAG: O-antigen ligase family protein [Weeksellaceae bacterium]|nr:O-antigen ligase family protein [Weeksellaceae bacterium]
MNFIKKIKKEIFIDCCLGLLLASLPLPFGFINIALGLFIISCIISYKELKFNRNIALFIPIIYYCLCVFSLAFSIDTQATLKYLSKGIFFLIIPLFFLFIPKLSKERCLRIFDIFSYSMVVASIIYLIRATINYYISGDTDHFFYHSLVTLDVNAIYISLFIGLAFINLLNKASKKIYDYIFTFILFGFLILLSSKNVIVITLIAMGFSLLRLIKIKQKKSIIALLIVGILMSIPLSKKIYERFDLEFINTSENVVLENGIINVSIKNAWDQKHFDGNHYFNGSSFRVYQIRIFNEIMQENNSYLTGIGVSAEQEKIKEKQINYELDNYYGDLNFHNQYIQSFAGLGVMGIILVVILNLNNWIKSIRQRDILFFYFTLLTTSIMFTESLFERQRGIVFFVILYCIFNQINTSIPNTKNPPNKL